MRDELRRAVEILRELGEHASDENINNAIKEARKQIKGDVVEKDWKVILSHNDVNERVGKHQEPKSIDSEYFYFDNKEEAVDKFINVLKYYLDLEEKGVVYDWKSHGNAAFKFYHEQNKRDILTYVLLYFQGEEYHELEFEVFDKLDT